MPVWTMYVWTMTLGKTASMASGKPLSPSQQAMKTSSTPRFLSAVFLYCAPVADFDDERVQVHHRVDGLQGTSLPRTQLVQHRVGGAADELRGHLKSRPNPSVSMVTEIRVKADRRLFRAMFTWPPPVSSEPCLG